MAVLEASVRRLRDLVRAAGERRWLHENREAITHYNRCVAEHGLLADEAAQKGLRDDAHTAG
jgi:post-segregation antitoxin (ccd killing protein)